MAAFPGVRVGAAAEVLWPEIMDPGIRILQQVPDDNENATSDSDDGAFLAPPAGDPSVTLTPEGIRSAGHDGGLAQDPGEIAVAAPGRTVALGFPG